MNGPDSLDVTFIKCLSFMLILKVPRLFRVTSRNPDLKSVENHGILYREKMFNDT